MANNPYKAGKHSAFELKGMDKKYSESKTTPFIELVGTMGHEAR
jgi:hypothetical protein